MIEALIVAYIVYRLMKRAVRKAQPKPNITVINVIETPQQFHALPQIDNVVAEAERIVRNG